MKSNYLSHYEHVYCFPVFFPYSDFLLSANVYNYMNLILQRESNPA